LSHESESDTYYKPTVDDAREEISGAVKDVAFSLANGISITEFVLGLYEAWEGVVPAMKVLLKTAERNAGSTEGESTLSAFGEWFSPPVLRRCWFLTDGFLTGRQVVGRSGRGGERKFSDAD